MFAPIAQLDRVTDYESAGCPFESGWARQKARKNFSKKNALKGLTRFDNCGIVHNEKRKSVLLGKFIIEVKKLIRPIDKFG